MHEMERRKRVSQIMNSKEFKKELEDIIDVQLQAGMAPTGLLALQQISELLYPRSQVKQSLGWSKGGGALAGSAPVIPIADIRGIEAHKYSKAEKHIRSKLAALYRLIDLFGWSQGIYNHITVRISPDTEHFLINPFGLMYHEVTAASLIKVNLQGDVLDQGSTTLGVNKAGFTLHSAIHAARPDIKCIIHLHTAAAVAVSAMQCGFLPISQEACIVGDVSYHDYQGIILSKEEGDEIMRKFSEGSRKKVMFLRNHGIIACGETIDEAFHYAVNVMQACETQQRLMAASSGNMETIIQIAEDVKDRVHTTTKKGGGGVDTGGKKWRLGQLEFEAYMRLLDNAGYRTGYMYAYPNIKQEKMRGGEDDVTIPPASQSFVFDDNDSAAYKQYMQALKKVEKSRWLNSPNVYQKVEIEETGTPDPKKITKWVQEGSPTHSTPIKIDNPNQFVPSNTDIKEFKQKQAKMKFERRQDKMDSGPTSKILEGATWEDAEKSMRDSNLSGAADQVVVVGAASKGIIQRDHQHNAQVYRTYYAANPFGDVNDEDLAAYTKEVERKQKGLPPEEPRSPGSDEGDAAVNGEAEDRRRPGHDADRSRSSKEGSPTKELAPEKQKKEKKKGFRTPSFLKKKKKSKDDSEHHAKDTEV